MTSSLWLLFLFASSLATQLTMKIASTERFQFFFFDLSPFDEISPSNKFQLSFRLVSGLLTFIIFHWLKLTTARPKKQFKNRIFINICQRSSFSSLFATNSSFVVHHLKLFISKFTFNMQLNNESDDDDPMCERHNCTGSLKLSEAFNWCADDVCK